MSRPADHLLDRARALLDREEYDLVMGLLVAAIDNAPGDEDVVLRADALRGRVAEARAAATNKRASDDATSERRERPRAVVPTATVVTDPRHGESTRPKGRSRVAVVSAWSLLLMALGAATLIVLSPERVETLIAYHQLQDPFDVAREHARAGQADRAIAQAERLVDADDRAGAALLFIAEVARAAGDEAAERTALSRAARHPGAPWEVTLDAARRLLHLGADEAAIRGYTNAFQRGAPAEFWLEIAQVFHDLGRTEPATSLYRTILRAYDPDADSAARALRDLVELGDR